MSEKEKEPTSPPLPNTVSELENSPSSVAIETGIEKRGFSMSENEEEQASPPLSSAALELEDPQSTSAVEAEIESKGFRISENEEVPRKSSPLSKAVSESEDPPSTSAIETKTEKKVDKEMCHVCDETLWKYTCPRCEIKSCSLACVKEHKEQFKCSGERCKTEFVPMNEYSERHLLNDYRFLEDAGRTLYSYKNVIKDKPGLLSSAPYPQNRRSKLLMTAAGKRGVRLKMVPGAMKRHRTNTSFYTINSDTIDWHIEWCFVASGCLVHHERVPETDILQDAAQKYINPVNFPHLRKPLEIYRKEGLDNCRFFLKMEGLPANRKRFFQLDPSRTLAENLNGHSLVEHPTICIIPQSYDNIAEYQLLDREDFQYMDPVIMRHLTRNHPAFKDSGDLQSQILNPNSSVYKVDLHAGVKAEC